MLGLQGQNPQRPCHSPEPQSWGRSGGSPLRRRIPVPSAWFPLAQGWLWWWGSLSWGVVNFGIYTWINEEWALVTRNSRTEETPRKHRGKASEKPEEFSAIKHLLWFRWLLCGWPEGPGHLTAQLPRPRGTAHADHPPPHLLGHRQSLSKGP